MEWFGIPWWVWVFVIPELVILGVALAVSAIDGVAGMIQRARFSRPDLGKRHAEYIAAGAPFGAGDEAFYHWLNCQESAPPDTAATFSETAQERSARIQASLRAFEATRLGAQPEEPEKSP